MGRCAKLLSTLYMFCRLPNHNIPCVRRLWILFQRILRLGLKDSHKFMRPFGPVNLAHYLSKALDLLVPVSSKPHSSSTPGLSTMSSTWDLTSLCYEKPHLKAGFTLRCFQRLSVPNVATQLYPWQDNWYTSGSSTPVLSY